MLSKIQVRKLSALPGFDDLAPTPRPVYNEQDYSLTPDEVKRIESLGELTYEQARQIVRDQHFQRITDFFNWKTRPQNIPRWPGEVYFHLYKSNHWEGWHDWIGKPNHYGEMPEPRMYQELTRQREREIAESVIKAMGGYV